MQLANAGLRLSEKMAIWIVLMVIYVCLLIFGFICATYEPASYFEHCTPRLLMYHTILLTGNHCLRRTMCSAVLHNCAGRSRCIVTGRSEDILEHQILSVSTGSAARGDSSFLSAAAEANVHHWCSILCVQSGIVLCCSQTGEHGWQGCCRLQVVTALQSLSALMSL